MRIDPGNRVEFRRPLRSLRAAARRGGKSRAVPRLLILLAALVAIDVSLHFALRKLNVAWLEDLYIRAGSDGPPYVLLRPGASLAYTGVTGGLPATRIDINSLGFRDRERPAQKPAGTYRIFCIGDSYTMGLGVELDQAFPARLEAKFKEEGLDRVEVWNAGVAAYAMYDYAPYLKSAILPLKPDLIILQICGNDAVRSENLRSPLMWSLLRLSRFSGIAKAGLALGWESKDLEMFEAGLREFLDQCSTAGLPVYIWAQSLPEGGEGAFASLSKQYNVRLIDLSGFKPETLPDDAHYSPKGYADLAKVVFPQLKGEVEALYQEDSQSGQE